MKQLAGSVFCVIFALFSQVGNLCTGVEEENGQTVDLTLRYVNDSVISLGDVMQRNAMRLADYQRRGRPQPNSRAEIIEFAQETLDQLTNEELLIQYGHSLAEERGFRLVNHERISQIVMERAKASGRGVSLRQQAEERKHIERKQIMDLVLGYFESRVPHIPPAVIEHSYEARKGEFKRPARARVLQLMLRPSTSSELREINEQRIALFKRAQDVADPVIRQGTEARLEAYIVAPAADQEHILIGAIGDIVKQQGREGLDAVTQDLIQQAVDLEKRASQLRDEAETKQLAERLFAELKGKSVDDFKALASKVSQGPNAIDGGDMGWIESGILQPDFDEAVFTTAPVGETSPVFCIDGNAYLIFVSERIPGHTRTFAEVVGEIEQNLQREQSEAIRETAVAMLRKKASIRDIQTIERLLQR